MKSRITDDVFFSIVEQSHDAVIISDGSSRVVYWNDAAEGMFGFSANEMYGKDFHDFICPEYLRAKAKSSIRRFIANEGSETVGMVGGTVTVPALHKSKREPFFVELSISNIADCRGKRWIFAFLRDCTARVLNQQVLQEHAESDPLTGISNRRAFQGQLEALQGKAVTLTLFDLDFFKRVNDRYGHDVGDEAIKFFVREFLSQLEKPCLIARTGGEEFAALYTGVAQVDVVRDLENMRQCYLNAMSNEESIPVCTFSAGVSITNHLISSRHLLKQADIAMYRAKHLGRNRIELFSPLSDTE